MTETKSPSESFLTNDDVLNGAVVLLIGATGTLGKKILLELIGRKTNITDLSIRALVRNSNRACLAFEELGVSKDEIEVVEAQLTDKEAITPAIRDATHIIYTSSPRAENKVKGVAKEACYIGVKNVSEVAKECGVCKHIIYCSTQGTQQQKHCVSKMLNLFYDNIVTWKAMGEAAVIESEIPYTILRPAQLTDGERQKSTTWIKLVQTDKFTGSVTYADSAYLHVELLFYPNTQNKTFEYCVVAQDTDDASIIADRTLKHQFQELITMEKPKTLETDIVWANKKETMNPWFINCCCCCW